MSTEQEKEQVREMIKSFYAFAHYPLSWNGVVNEQVAKVFGTMIHETQKCSKAFSWVPKPPGGVASITWLVKQLGRGVFYHYRPHLSVMCAKEVIRQWNSVLIMASLGIAATRLPAWA